MRKSYSFYLFPTLVAVAVSFSQVNADEKKPPPKSALFRNAVRPLLIRKCLTCHNSEKKKGRLDLSTRKTAVKGGRRKSAIIPKHPEQSLVIKRIIDREMPPGNPLSNEQIALFKKWIAQGAIYDDEPLTDERKRSGPDWWAFQPIRRPPLPATRWDDLAVNAIDRFIFAELQKHKLQPSPIADRRTLLRRVTIDLTGLPPTPSDLAAFLEDTSPGAYERAVDQLLASPAYGERWARHWLDVVRYGESHGYEQNHLRANAWPFRDYVIVAFNSDKPYTDFVAEQLAGDLLGKQRPSALRATGFLVAGVHDTVGNRTVEGTRQQRANDLDDMVTTIGAAFLGLTLNCAKCHDHKFDPIPQKDHYRLAAVVSGVRHGERLIAPTNASPTTDREQTIRKLRKILGKIDESDQEARVKALLQRGVRHVLRPPVNARRNLEWFRPVKARFIRFTILAVNNGSQPCIDEIEVFGPKNPDDSLASATHGSKATASSLLPGYPIHQIHHLNDGKFGNAHSWISNTRGTGWAMIGLPKPALISKIVWARDSAGLKPKYTDRVPTQYRVEVSLDGIKWQKVSDHHNRAVKEQKIPLVELLKVMTDSQRTLRSLWQGQANRLAASLQTESQKAYVGQFTQPEPIYLLTRGDVMKRTDVVPPGALTNLPHFSEPFEINENLGEPGRRLALAKWICDPKNPLTARIMVNRLWYYHFGQGIVANPSDFGFNGGIPSHPKLLDWLASEFVAGGWSLKRMHRMIVLSHTYRQSNRVTEAGSKIDAGNRLLWRMPLRRMEAEVVRDAFLFVSGGLIRTMGGPGFRLFNYRVVNVAIYEPLRKHGPDTWRRCVYQQSARAYRDEMLATLDCPECAQLMPKRPVTTTPLQAMTLLNGDFVVHQAKLFAERVQREAGDAISQQVRHCFRLALGRAPTESEQHAAEAVVRRHDLAVLCRVLFNANEFLYY